MRGSDSTFIHGRHQIGLNMGEFIPLFRTQNTNYKLNYRFKVNQKYSLRSSFQFDQETGDDGRLQFGTRLGIDRVIRSYKNFSIYGGIDYNAQIEKNNADQRENYWLGPSLFIGFKYQPARFISFSTEPGFYWNRRIFKDPLSFGDKISKWNELQVGNIGHLLMSFHF